jgi:hypothetical protein
MACTFNGVGFLFDKTIGRVYFYIYSRNILETLSMPNNGSYAAFAALVNSGKVNGMQVRDMRVRVYFTAGENYQRNPQNFTNVLGYAAEKFISFWDDLYAHKYPDGFERLKAFEERILEEMNTHADNPGLTFTSFVLYGWEASVETMLGLTPPALN